MSNRVQEVAMVLTGAYRGKTLLLNGHAFKRGVAHVYVSPESADAFLTVMRRSYQCYPEGSPELAAADERDRANGLLRDIQADSSATDGASAPVSSSSDHHAGQVSDPGALRGEGHADGAAGSARVVSSGPGHADAGLVQGMEPGAQRESDALMRAIHEQVSKLDHTVDDQWTLEGLPSVNYVAEAVKNQTVTREMIQAVAPGFNRQQAEDLAQF